MVIFYNFHLFFVVLFIGHTPCASIEMSILKKFWNHQMQLRVIYSINHFWYLDNNLVVYFCFVSDERLQVRKNGWSSTGFFLDFIWDKFFSNKNFFIFRYCLKPNTILSKLWVSLDQLLFQTYLNVFYTIIWCNFKKMGNKSYFII